MPPSPEPYCRHCGRDLPPESTAFYCSRNHREKDRQRRQLFRLRFPDGPLNCPIPDEVAYPNRGAARRAIDAHQHLTPALCESGHFHLHPEVPNSEQEFCIWCGGPVRKEARYCTLSHAGYAQAARARVRALEIEQCPHPELNAFEQRGAAIRFAADGDRVKRCCCGKYHSIPSVAASAGTPPLPTFSSQ